MSDIDFDKDKLSGTPLAERAELCVDLAGRAKALAEASPLQQQEHYLLIAHAWLRLAEQIEQTLAESGTNVSEDMRDCRE
jgi:hypothetical protein